MLRPIRAASLLAIIMSALPLNAMAGPGAGGDTYAVSAPENDKPMVTATVAADREAVGPGDTFNALVTLKMADGVHVYWRNPGETGLPTEFRWTGPEGFRFGRTQFPAPESKYDKVLKETSYIHSDSAMFLTPIKAPDTLKAGETLTFNVDVSWLSCRKGACVPGGEKLTLKLPAAAKSKPVNDDALEEFDAARSRVPSPSDKAEHLKIAVRTSKASVGPGESFDVIVTAQIEAKHHMQSDKPLEDYLIPAYVFIEPVRDAEVGEVVYPKSHIRNDPMMGKMSEYSGTIEFKFPVTLEKETDNKPRWIRGILQSQICTDEGTCYAPQTNAFAVAIQIEGGPAPAASPEEFVAATPMIDDTPTDGGADSPEVVTTPSPTRSAATADGDSRGIIGRIEDALVSLGYAGVLLLAFLGGIALNLMPCVLPVISLKILSFVRQAEEDRRRIFALGLAYCAGIVVFFGALSWLYYSGGQSWGQHFQNPYVVLILAAIITAFGLSLFGVFAVFTPKFVNQLGVKAEEREGLPSAFFTGLLATVLGTACTGPGMSVALGAASKTTPFRGAMIFMTVGVGMMLPFLILSAKPAWLKFVPKPGRWMGTFEAIMGFALFGTAIFILNPISTQLGNWGLVLGLMFLLGVCIAAWIRGKAQFATDTSKRVPLNIAALAMLAVAWVFPFQWLSTVPKLRAEAEEHQRLYELGLLTDLKPKGTEKDDLPEARYPEDEIFWLPYQKDLVRRFVEEGHTVFVDFTAEWCANCKWNEAKAIDVVTNRNLMREYRVVPFKADYTSQSPGMTRIIKSYERDGVPMYLIFSPGRPDDPQVMSGLLTEGQITAAIKQAGPSRTADPIASASAAELSPPRIETDARH